MSNGVQVISRAIEILRLMRKHNGALTLGKLSVDTALPKSTVQRIVGTLVDEGLMKPSTKSRGFVLGPGFYALSIQGLQDVINLLRPFLEDLSQRTGETVDLAFYTNHRLEFVDQIPGSQRLRAISAVGDVFPLSNTANGHAVLQFLPSSERSAILQRENVTYDQHEALLNLRPGVDSVFIGEDLDQKDVGISAAGIGFQCFEVGIFAISVVAPSTRYKLNRNVILKELRATAGSLSRIGLVFS